mgnify:CR=1 FL=1
MSNIFRGLGVALITPFKSDMSIDFEALERLVNYQLDNGADFLCILATTGETPCLTRSEKDEITRVVKSVVKGRVPLLKYCGGNNTRAVIEEMKSSDWEGIDGILSICPYYNKPSQEGLYQHFKAIAEASPLPLVLYNVPGRTGVNRRPRRAASPRTSPTSWASRKPRAAWSKSTRSSRTSLRALR